MADKDWTTKARGALTRYRWMAWITGGMLLLLTAELIIKYVLRIEDPTLLGAIGWIPFAHGWIYVLYLVTVLDLWSSMRWGFGRLVTMVLAGVVPVMSFVLERRVHADAEVQIASGGPVARSTVRADDGGAH